MIPREYKVDKMNCKICNNSQNNKIYKIKEMMFNSGESFEYLECSHCGCLQITHVPPNIEKYYSGKYYSFKRNYNKFLKHTLTTKRDEYALFKKNFLGKLLYKRYPHDLLFNIGKCNLKYDSKILDVGCGSGNLLYSLKNAGFGNLVGIDPYLKKEITSPRLKIVKKEIQEMSEKFDLIIFSHSLEHMDKHAEIIQKISNILNDGGYCIVSMPLKTDYIWDLYGTNWVQIDAPRHILIHSFKSFSTIIKNANLNVKSVEFNSNEFLFWGSEQYKRNIHLEAENSYANNPKGSIFTGKQIKEFKDNADNLNKRNSGDQAIFILEQ